MRAPLPAPAGAKGPPPPLPKGAKGAPPPPPGGRGKAAPPKAEAEAEPSAHAYVAGTSDVTEVRPPLGLADAADDDEESGEFSVDDDELIDDQPR
jgi:hypothetical protein